MSTATTSGLQLLGNSSLINDICFERVITLAFHNLLNETNHRELGDVESETVNMGFLKQTYGALVVVVVEAAKNDLDATSLSSILEECQMDSQRATTVIEHFTKHKTDIRNKLRSYGSSFPHIVDTDWRLDYCIKSDLMDKINEPVYHVSFKTEKSGQNEPEDVRFACTLEQMQDLVSKLKEATKCVEKASQM